jgi:hypothetical protein
MRLMRLALESVCILLLGAQGREACAQAAAAWTVEDSGTTAGLRGIDSVDGKIAWASGTDGTVLRTLDGGEHWTRCAIPDVAKDGATLDFRGVEARDAKTATVMASGPGAKSRLYRTTDGCRTWKLLFRNPDTPNGFFDSFWLNGSRGMLLGDPVRDRFAVFSTTNGGKSWKRDKRKGLGLDGRLLAAFAASNRCIPVGNRLFARGFATGGKGGAIFFSRLNDAEDEGTNGILARLAQKKIVWSARPIAVTAGADSAGVFSIAYRYPVTTGICKECSFADNSRFIAVGGDYTKPSEGAGAAAWSADGGWTWTASTTMPRGYRSAAQWTEPMKAWIAVGTNGSDISRDDGKTWTALDDGDWNAVSLPFVVGPKGRIAKLNSTATAILK